ncbi:PDZ domain-containing protein [bacterium]|nr:PDZ domain-containing protein [bacterium]
MKSHLAPVLIACLALGAAFPGAARAQDASEKVSQEVEKLISDLGNDDYQKRDQAQRKLEGLGRKALPALRKAELESKDAEVRARAHEAIAAIEKASPGRSAPPADREKSGELEPNQPKVEPPPEEPQVPGLDPNDFLRDFDRGMPDAMKKLLERVRKQFDELDRQFDERNRHGPGVRTFRFGVRPRTPAEEKLGLTLEPPSPALRSQLDLSPTDAGVLVDELTVNGRAWKAGLKLYDVVTSIDGKPVRTANDLSDLGSREAKLEVIRKAKKETILVHPADAVSPDKAPPDDKPEKKDPVRKF